MPVHLEVNRLRSNDGLAASTQGMLRVAVVGCGYIAQQLHLPILAGHEKVNLAALVDRDVDRARELARDYGIETVYADAGELNPEQVDAAIVATPPFHHAPCAFALLQRGLHVLVEKPVATTYADAMKLVQAAEETGRVLAVGFFRRLMPSVCMLKALLDSHWLGHPVGFEVLYGSFYSGASVTLGNMRKECAGGGMLMDYGSHLVDLLHFFFDGPAEVLEYRDNALGGIETDCLARLRLAYQREPVEGRIELSRTRKLGDSFRVMCEHGTIEYQTTERYRIRVFPHGLELEDPLHQVARSYDIHASWMDEPETSWYETMRAEIDDWLRAIQSGNQAKLSGRSALPTVKVIEECYRQVQPLTEPWVQEGFHRHQAVPVASHDAHRPRRVLITGATGFIGCRVAEVLSLRDGWQVRALVHNPGNAARLARLPVEMVQTDLERPEDVGQLVEGCDAVVHCAMGTDWGDRKRLFAVNVNSTRHLAQAALPAGVRRFVHLSSVTVNGQKATGVIDESTPLQPARGDDYAESKAEGEKVILGAARDGLSTVILRLCRVYGPFSRVFVIRPVEALAKRRFRLLPCCDGPANLVYVDNVVEAIVRALDMPDDRVKGEAFLISDGDDVTWREFYTQFAYSLGYEAPPVFCADGECDTASEFSDARWWWPPAWYRGFKTLLTSQEFRSLGRKVLQTDPLGRLPRWILRRFPGLERRLKADAWPLHRRVQSECSDNWVELGATEFRVSIAKARRVLGYQPVVSRERAMELTLEWVRYAGLV